MGCHTLFYKPYKISLKKAKKLLLKQYKQELTYYSDENIDDEIINKRKALQRGIILLENDLLPEKDIWEDLLELPEGQFPYYIKDKGVFIEVEYHDIFRVWHYPDDELFSYEQTIEFINKCLIDDEKNVYFIHDVNNNALSDKEYVLKKLKEFWDKYPNGMIRFG